MAVIAVINNAAELAAEIETRTGLLQAIKEGNLPSYIQTVYGVSPGTEVEVTPPVVDTAPIVTATIAPVVPSLVVPTAPTI